MLPFKRPDFRLLQVIVLSLLVSALITGCGGQADRTTVPVEIPVSQVTGHSAFESAISRFAAQIAHDVAVDSTGSISAAVVVGNDVVWEQGFGWADVENRIPADAHTIYRTGSISKSFTAVLMMQMIERGYFALDDAVEDHFADFQNLIDKPEGAGKITFRQMASHTAGLIREPRLEGAASGPISGWEEKIIESIPHTAYQSLPGERYSYSNIGFGILGLATSRIAGESFMDLVTEHIFEPLGMESSFFIVTPELLPHLSMGYQRSRDGSISAEMPALEHAGRGYKVPNGGIYSTVGDLAKFVAAMTGASPEKIFTEETRMEMLKRQTPEGGGGYGLGFSVSIDEDGFITRGHGGSVAGYNANMVFDPESQIGVTILRNYSGGATNLGRASRALLKELVNSR
ncbi:serine hydrolase [candidate division KSB1 bacterium]